MEENKKQRIYKTIMLVALTAFITFMTTSITLYSHYINTESSDSSLAQTLKIENSNNNVLGNYLTKIKNIIDSYYLWNDEIDESKMEEAAIQGYISGLGDRYTQYIPAEEMKEYQETIKGSYTGIGIYMFANEESNRVIVYYPIPESPAEKSGIKAGDKIIRVDGVEYTADDFSIISSYIKGEEGSSVNIVVERDGEYFTFDIKREKINTSPVLAKTIENDIGYVQIPSFDEGTAEAFKSKVEELQKEGIKSLVIDLRNNGGGIVEESTKIADYLLESGKTIISTVDNKDNKEITFSKENPIFTMPVAVLVNGNSASAAEILTTALKDNERAKIIGTKTFGKGVIQVVLTLTDGSGLKITSSEYYTPHGGTIQEVGIEPDEVVELSNDITNQYVVSEEQDTQLKKAIEILK